MAASDAAEREFLAAYDASTFPGPAVAVDVAVLAIHAGGLEAVLLRRAQHPARGRWALPGGFVGLEESLDAAAERVLRDKASLRDVFLEQLYTFGATNRDPRTRVISVAYYALVEHARLAARVAEAPELALARLHVSWSGESGGPAEARGADGAALPLVFDHDRILGTAVQRIRGKLNYSPIGFQLLPREFTLRELQRVHEAVLERRLNKDSFRRRMLATDLLEPTGGLERAVGHRPAALYRFRRDPRRGGRGRAAARRTRRKGART